MSRFVLLCLLAAGCGDTPSQPDANAASASPTVSAKSVPLPETEIRFTDVTTAAGVIFTHEAGASGKKWYPETMGAGGGFFDYNGDGRQDILLLNGRRWPGERQAPEPTMRLYRNQGDGTFQDVTRQSKLDVPLYGMGMVAADYDNDGDQDLVVTAYQQTVLFRNEGDGTFTDITSSAGLAQGGWSTATVFVDVDRDGWLDLLVGHYVDWEPQKEEGLECTYGTPQKDYCAVSYFRGLGLKLYRNLGDGRFRDVTSEAGVTAPEARVLGITLVDHNQDGWPDLLVANDLTPTLFFANQGNGTFREIGMPSGIVLDEGGVAFAGMGIDAAYLKNDDQLCVAIGNFSGQPTTLHCQVPVQQTYLPEVFTEQSHRAELARPTLRMVTFGLFFFDVDLDGWQDLFMVNGHVVNEEHLRNVPYAQRPQLFRNRRDGTFAEVMPKPGSGLDLRIIGRGAAYADYDQDGDLDLLLTANQGAAYLLRNDTPRQGHFLRVTTLGTRSNRNGIGAQVSLYTGHRRLRAMVRTGGSYLSQNELTLTFGLQAEEQIDRLEVSWPSGATDVFRGLDRDTTFLAREGDAPTGLGSVAQASVPSPPPAFLELKRTAMAHYEAGRRQAALEAFQQVVQQHPSDFMAQQYLIELYWRQNNHAAAQSLLQRMRQDMPEANFLMQFAFHMEELRLHDLANQIYEAALGLDPQLAEAYYRLGKNALQAGRYEKALTQFQQALQRHAGLVDAHRGIGLVLARQGKMTEAEAQFHEVLRLSPDDVEAYNQLGEIYTRTGRLDAAMTVYEKVIRLQPERARGYHNLGSVLAAKGMKADARNQFQEALRRDPQYFAAHNDLGTLYAEQGDLDKAIAAFRAALQVDPRSAPAHYNLAMAYAAQGNLDAMQGELQKTLHLQPAHLEASLNLGVSYLQSGRVEEAIRQLQNAVNIAPSSSQAHYFLAVAYAQNGQLEPMHEALRQVVRLDPNHAKAHSALASLYYQRQQYDLAWQHGQKALQLGAPVQPLLEALRQIREQGKK